MALFRKRADTFDYALARTCITCGHNFQGRYCSRCGEKVADREEKSLRYFAEGILNAFTFLDGKFLRTLKLMLQKPGQFSADFNAGKRVPYVRPISIFFVANFFYFLVPTWDTYNSSLHTQLNLLPHSEKATQLVNQYVEKNKLSLETFQVRYEQQSGTLAKMLIVVFVLLTSIVFLLLNYRNDRYTADHITVALEVNTLSLLMISVVFSWLVIGVVAVAGWVGYDWTFIYRTDTVVTLLSMAILAYFVSGAERRAYRQNLWKTILKTGVVVYFFYDLVNIYRMFLFYVTLWTL